MIKKTVAEAKLSENSQSRLEKAHRVFTNLIATISFFWVMINAHLKELSLSKEIESIMREILIPYFYLLDVAKKAKSADRKNEINTVASTLKENLENLDTWKNMDKHECDLLNKSAKALAKLFQRSSSCVEGRNGQLSLRHHGLHNFSTRKLNVLTVLHNFFIQRPDKTTAAERLFERKPRDLFEYLLKNFKHPPRPRKNSQRLIK